jgi:hypothetical protein
MEHDELDVDAALADLPREDAVPRDLERRILSELHTRGALRTPRRSLRGPLGMAAGLALAFAAGWLTRALPPTPPEEEPLFLLLLGGGDDPDALTGSASDSVEQHRSWARSLRAEGRLVEARKLTPEGLRLADPEAAPTRLRQDPRSEPLLGFFLVRARDLEEAVALARRCPNLGFGGSVIVRPIDPT